MRRKKVNKKKKNVSKYRTKNVDLSENEKASVSTKISETKKYFWLGIAFTVVVAFFTIIADKLFNPLENDVQNLQIKVADIQKEIYKEMKDFQINNFSFLNNLFPFGYVIFSLEEKKLYHPFDSEFSSRFEIKLLDVTVSEIENTITVGVEKIWDRRSDVKVRNFDLSYKLPPAGKILHQSTLVRLNDWAWHSL